MNFLEAMQTGRYFVRPSWAAGYRVKFVPETGLVSLVTGGTEQTIVNLVPQDYNAKDFVLFEPRKSISGTQLKEVLERVIIAAPRCPTRNQLKERVVTDALAALELTLE